MKIGLFISLSARPTKLNIKSEPFICVKGFTVEDEHHECVVKRNEVFFLQVVDGNRHRFIYIQDNVPYSFKISALTFNRLKTLNGIPDENNKHMRQILEAREKNRQAAEALKFMLPDITEAAKRVYKRIRMFEDNKSKFFIGVSLNGNLFERKLRVKIKLKDAVKLDLGEKFEGIIHAYDKDLKRNVPILVWTNVDPITGEFIRSRWVPFSEKAKTIAHREGWFTDLKPSVQLN